MLRSISLESQWKAENQNGESLHFRNCKGGYFSDKEEYGLKVVGKTEGVAGKNLLQIKSGSITSYSIIYTFAEDARITAQGLPSGNGGRLNFSDFFSPLPLSAGVTYCFSVNGTFEGVNLMVSNLTTGSSKSVIPRGGTSGTYTPTADESVIVGFNMNAAYTVNIDCYIQCEAGDTPTEYVPYGGVTRIVKAGTKVVCGNEIVTPCNLYEGDVWYPMSGKVTRSDMSIEQYNPQPIFAYPGTVYITQTPTDLPGVLSATMLVHR